MSQAKKDVGCAPPGCFGVNDRVFGKIDKKSNHLHRHFRKVGFFRKKVGCEPHKSALWRCFGQVWAGLASFVRIDGFFEISGQFGKKVGKKGDL